MQDERNINIDKATRDAGKDLLEELLRVSTQGGKTTQPENKTSETTKKIPSDLAGLLHFFELIDASIEEAEKKRKQAKEDNSKIEIKEIKKDVSPSSSKSHCCLFDPDWFMAACEDDPFLNVDDPEASKNDEAPENNSVDPKEQELDLKGPEKEKGQEDERIMGEEKYGPLFQALIQDNLNKLNEWTKQLLRLKVQSQGDETCQYPGYYMELAVDNYYNALCELRRASESAIAKLEYFTTKKYEYK